MFTTTGISRDAHVEAMKPMRELGVRARVCVRMCVRVCEINELLLY